MTDNERVEVEFVRELDGFRGRACLVKRGDRFFVVSSVVAYSGFETLVFESDKSGDPLSWGDVAGGRGMTRDEAIEDLAQGVREWE